MAIPADPKIYHIVHVDRIPSIIQENGLLSDIDVIKYSLPGTVIGMQTIKKRRLTELTLSHYPDLYVGACVPFYFCPRSIMLYMFYCNNNPEITYRGGQTPIIHLEADLFHVIDWLDKKSIRWAFTNSNAGSRYFLDFTNVSDLDKINWNAVQATHWSGCKEEKQAEFLVEKQFSWDLFERIGVYNESVYRQVNAALKTAKNRPAVEIHQEWYY